ncbi:MAG: hypothetical protein NTZ50_07740, partial [Chloroflexi bacterium]|nr:hypothetical protein [Chloroflexota bacterium]
LYDGNMLNLISRLVRCGHSIAIQLRRSEQHFQRRFDLINTASQRVVWLHEHGRRFEGGVGASPFSAHRVVRV